MKHRLLLLGLAGLLIAAPTFAQNYNLVTSWPATGHAIAASSNAVFVVGSKTTKFTLDGSVSGHWAFTGNDISVSPAGEVYLTDDESIRKYDAEGAALGELPLYLTDPLIAVTGDNIFLAGKDPDDPLSGLLLILDLSGVEQSRIRYVDTDWRGVASHAGGAAAVSYYRGGHYPVVTLACTATSPVPLVRTCHSDEDPERLAYSEPHGLATASTDEFFVADACDSSVRKYGSDGTPGIRWSIGAIPVDLTVDTAGNVYVLTEYDVRKFAPGTLTPVARTSWGQLKTRWANRGR